MCCPFVRSCETRPHSTTWSDVKLDPKTRRDSAFSQRWNKLRHWHLMRFLELCVCKAVGTCCFVTLDLQLFHPTNCTRWHEDIGDFVRLLCSRTHHLSFLWRSLESTPLCFLFTHTQQENDIHTRTHTNARRREVFSKNEKLHSREKRNGKKIFITTRREGERKARERERKRQVGEYVWHRCVRFAVDIFVLFGE